jgi:uncharacterized damage-inducible protein DinB
MLTEVRTVLLRDVDTLRREIALYPDEASLWRELPGLPNTGGTLALHLAGNLRHYIGATLGGSGYVRDRAAEFATRGLTRAELSALVDQARAEVSRALDLIDPASLDSPYPAAFDGRSISTRLFLLHLAVHLTYHLGQLDYHRRMVSGDSAGAGALSLAALLT